MTADKAATATARSKSAAYMMEVRSSLGLSRREAAERIGCSVSTLGRYEREGLPRGIRWSKATGICKSYGISADRLLSVIMGR